jgi:hypothetical protein
MSIELLSCFEHIVLVSSMTVDIDCSIVNEKDSIDNIE